MKLGNAYVEIKVINIDKIEERMDRVIKKSETINKLFGEIKILFDEINAMEIYIKVQSKNKEKDE